MTDEHATSRDTAQMADLARRYCRLIEHIGEQRDPSWLREIFMLLPKLHVAVVSLKENGAAVADDEGLHPVPEDEERHVAELEDRFEHYTRILEELGEHDTYWLEFDPVGHSHEEMSGSLADDLVDIYHDVKHGLELLEQRGDEAVRHWKRTYRLHWGQHLVDAERHLYALKAHRTSGH